MTWIHSASSFLAISQLLFLASLYLVYFPGRRLARLIALFCTCVIAYIFSRQPEIRGLPFIPDVLALMAIAAPAVLWVSARYLFEDERRVHPLAWVLIISYMSLRFAGQQFFEGTPPRGSLPFLLLYFLPQLIMLGLACHVVYMACRGRESDLVELRRQLRVPFAIGMGSIVGLIIGAGFFWDGSWQTDSLYFSLIFLLILFINLGMFQIHKDAPDLIHSAGEHPGPLPAVIAAPVAGVADAEIATATVSRHDQIMIDRVLKAMKQERLYAESGLTIGDLAARVSVQEYRLRKLINQSLHYRNFNQFLNRYRIEEAARRLLDPEEEHIPISSIALDVGYASLSSFNKAFKEIHGVTPSVYRSGQAE
ncbi:MAG TPA: helix-turn-helix transcriptional regulator [Pseudohongiella sp.]|nr:helix-turn-helix transcriptional regulator [Pseudohongiella sp.]